jgi:hypothetical protein
MSVEADMNYGRAFGAGVLGAVVMSAMFAMARAMGIPANLELMLGTMFGMPPSGAAGAIGLVMHLMIGGILALAYGAVFDYLGRSSWGLGLAFGAVHAIIAGFFMGMMPMMHPLVPEVMPAPGFFMSNLGAMGVMGETVGHLVYGAIIGGLYPPVHHERSAQLHGA